MERDRADAAWLWQEAVNRLESLSFRVREGRDLEAAAEFCRFILFSRVDKLLQPFAGDGGAKVDPAYLMWKAKDLLQQVQDLHSSGKVPEKANSSAMEGILHKLDMIAGHVAKFSPPEPKRRKARATLRPALRVIAGGGK
jgi:hypothetical protein